MLKYIPKKPLLLIPAVMVAAVGLVTILAWNALQPIYQKNGFTRYFIATELTMLNVVEKDEMVTGIAGATDHRIYFKTKDPAKLWVTDHELQNGKYINLNVPNGLKIASAFYIAVDSPKVHIMAGNAPAVIEADLNGAPTFISRFPTALFTRAVTIGSNSYVFRGFDTTEKKAGQIFIKGNPRTGELVRNKNMIGKGSDAAGITSDGYLSYDQQTNLLTYVSFYSNQFFCLDTSLNLVYSGHTIDTMSTYQVEAGKAGNTITKTSPARIINGKSHAANGRVFIASKLQADNEKAETFWHSSVIDIYDMKTGNYQGSFYIPFYKREKVYDLKILKNKMIVIYKDNYIASYQLPSAIIM